MALRWWWRLDGGGGRRAAAVWDGERRPLPLCIGQGAKSSAHGARRVTRRRSGDDGGRRRCDGLVLQHGGETFTGPIWAWPGQSGPGMILLLCPAGNRLRRWRVVPSNWLLRASPYRLIRRLCGVLPRTAGLSWRMTGRRLRGAGRMVGSPASNMATVVAAPLGCVGSNGCSSGWLGRGLPAALRSGAGCLLLPRFAPRPSLCHGGATERDRKSVV